MPNSSLVIRLPLCTVCACTSHVASSIAALVLPLFALQNRLTSYFLDSSIARPPPRTSISRLPFFRLLRQNLPDDRCTKFAETNIGSDFSVIPPKFQPSFTPQICLCPDVSDKQARAFRPPFPSLYLLHGFPGDTSNAVSCFHDRFCVIKYSTSGPGPYLETFPRLEGQEGRFWIAKFVTLKTLQVSSDEN